MPSYKLIYFDLRARAEPIRLLFAYAGVEYEDVRIPMEEWPKQKNDMPFKQVPVLEVDGKRLCQSSAIIRFVARELGLAGRTSFEQAKADEFADTLHDMMLKLPWTEKDEEKKKELMKVAVTENIPPILAMIEANMGSGGYYTDELTYADMSFANGAGYLLEMNPAILDPTPKLKALYDRVMAIPKIAEYIETRPKTSM